MRVVPDASGPTLTGFVQDTVAPGVIVHTGGWMGYPSLAKAGYDHRPRSQRAAQKAGNPAPLMPRAHRAISNFRSWLGATHRSVSNKHLQVYLDEFVFRYNRRRSPMSAFQTILGLQTQRNPTAYRESVAQGPGARKRTRSNRYAPTEFQNTL
jgi:hypothetical protein